MPALLQRHPGWSCWPAVTRTHSSCSQLHVARPSWRAVADGGQGTAGGRPGRELSSTPGVNGEENSRRGKQGWTRAQQGQQGAVGAGGERESRGSWPCSDQTPTCPVSPAAQTWLTEKWPPCPHSGPCGSLAGLSCLISRDTTLVLASSSSGHCSMEGTRGHSSALSLGLPPPGPEPAVQVGLMFARECPHKKGGAKSTQRQKDAQPGGQAPSQAGNTFLSNFRLRVRVQGSRTAQGLTRWHLPCVRHPRKTPGCRCAGPGCVQRGLLETPQT